MLFSPNLWRTELAYLMVLLDSSFDAFYPEICCSWPCKSAHHYLYDYNRIRVLRTNFYTARVGADALCACEQSLYWATQSGFNCASEELIYFYHPDYLGSVEFVTDMRGEPYKLARRSFSEGGFFLNTPWGDRPLRNKPVACFREGASMPRGQQDQKAFTYKDFSSRFRFNGKERDDETGNYYYGARYYDPKTSVWLSVDPLAHEFPNWSPYNYCLNNPINLVDPDGNAPSNPDVITRVSNTRDVGSTVRMRNVNMTVNLTVVNMTGSDLSGTHFSNSSGSVRMGNFEGSATRNFISPTARGTIDKIESFTVNYKVVNSLDGVGENDNVMMIVNDIPAGDYGEGQIDPVGLATLGGRVSAVEAGTLKNGSFNEVSEHELGHNLGLGHGEGLMHKGMNGNNSLSKTQRGEVVGAQVSPVQGNGSYRDSRNDNGHSRSKAQNFLNENGIK